MVQARLGFGKNLLIHDTDPEQRLAVALEPATERKLSFQGEVAVYHLPPDASELQDFATAASDEVVWRM